MKLSHLGLIFSLGLATPSLAFSHSHEGAPAVLTTIKPLQLISAAITEGVTETQLLLPTNASPHDYHLKPSDVRKIGSADLIIWVGPELEKFMEKPLSASKAHKLSLLDKVEAHEPHDDEGEHHDEHDHHDEHEHHDEHADHHDEHEHHEEHADHHYEHMNHEKHEEHHDDHGHHNHDHGGKDPHIWLSPEQALAIAELITEELSEIDPHHHDAYEKNLAHFKHHLTEVDHEIEHKLEAVKDKGYFVFHDAYAGFEEHYGLNHLGSFTVSPERQPGAKHLLEIQKELREHNAVCVFKEPQFKPAVISAVTKGTDVKVGELDPLGSAIKVGPESYFDFLKATADSFYNCLK